VTNTVNCTPFTVNYHGFKGRRYQMDKIRRIEESQLKKDIPAFKPGDTIRVQIKIVEEGKTRLQAFEGVVIGRKGSSIRETFTVRRISYGEGVERVFHLHSPSIEKIELVKKGSVRRAKLYYLRKKIGKKAKIEEQARDEVG
jgi:large subunit ribosomal protein L19